MKLVINQCWQKIKKGELNALEQVYKTTYRSLVYYASELTGQANLAEEVVQDVFLNIWQNRSELTINGSFKAYLYQSVHNHALNVIRQQKSKKESVNTLISDNTWEFISETYDLNDNMIDRIYAYETEVRIEQIINSLPEQCRKVFLLSRFECLNNNEIAAHLGLSVNTVRAQIHTALKKIAFALKK
jgi:RNA polymerase sigma-70 factor, ECF subfamily